MEVQRVQTATLRDLLPATHRTSALHVWVDVGGSTTPWPLARASHPPLAELYPTDPVTSPFPPRPAPPLRDHTRRTGERGARRRGKLIVFCLRLPVFVYTRYISPARAVAQNAELRPNAALAIKIVEELCSITAVIINMLPFSYRYVLWHGGHKLSMQCCFLTTLYQIFVSFMDPGNWDQRNLIRLKTSANCELLIFPKIVCATTYKQNITRNICCSTSNFVSNCYRFLHVFTILDC